MLIFYLFSTIISSDCETSSVALATRTGTSVSFQPFKKVRISFTFAIAAKIFSPYFLYSQQKWNEISNTAATTTFKQWFEFRSNSRIQILAIRIQTDFFVFRNWKRVQHITEPLSWLIHSLQLLLQGATMFTKILPGQMPKWEEKLQSRWKQKILTGSRSICVCHEN